MEPNVLYLPVAAVVSTIGVGVAAIQDVRHSQDIGVAADLCVLVCGAAALALACLGGDGAGRLKGLACWIVIGTAIELCGLHNGGADRKAICALIAGCGVGIIFIVAFASLSSTLQRWHRRPAGQRLWTWWRASRSESLPLLPHLTLGAGVYLLSAGVMAAAT